MKNPMLNKIKWAYQRVIKGYDDRIYWVFDDYLYDIVVEPLKRFCEDELKELKNPTERKEVYETTLKLIRDYEAMDEIDGYKPENPKTKFWEYFGKHIGYFWT